MNHPLNAVKRYYFLIVIQSEDLKFALLLPIILEKIGNHSNRIWDRKPQKQGLASKTAIYPLKYRDLQEETAPQLKILSHQLDEIVRKFPQICTMQTQGFKFQAEPQGTVGHDFRPIKTFQGDQ